MHKILFRGFNPCKNWDTTIYVEGKTVKGRWVEGYYVKLNNGGKKNIDRIYTGYAETDCGEWYPDSYEVLPSTICRYTGLTDKNGRKAFVGDAVCYKGEYHTVYGVIRFGEIPDGSGHLKNIGYFTEWQDGGVNTWGDWWRCDLGFWLEDEKCKVIGTIWDEEDIKV